MTLSKHYGDTNFITGMRAFAAFCSGIDSRGWGGLRDYGDIGNRIVDLSQNGVAIFFVISGYTVASSYVASEGYGHYIYKRIWRIVPLYYFWIGFAILTETTHRYWRELFHVHLGAYNVFMHASFLSFLDYKIANSILGVEWTIPIEVFWYLLIPLLVTLIKKHRHLYFAVILSISIYVLCLKYKNILHVPSQDADLAIKWNPIPYALGFCLGIVAFKLRQSRAADYARWGNTAFLTSFLLLIVFIILPVSKLPGSPYIFFQYLRLF